METCRPAMGFFVAGPLQLKWSRLKFRYSRIQAEGQAFLKSISEDNDIRKRNRNNHKSGYPNQKQNLVQSVTKRHAGLRVNLFRA